MVGNGYVITGNVTGAIGAPLLTTALCTFAVSVYLAHFFEQQRLAYGRQGIQLAAEAARAGADRFVGVNDGLWDWSVEFNEAYFTENALSQSPSGDFFST